MKVGIFAKTFPGTAPLDVLTAAKAAGYATVQYNMACSGLGSLPGVIADDAISDITRASISTGVEIAAISATYNMIHPDLDQRKAGRKSFAAISAAARKMDTRLITVCTGSCDAENQWREHPGNNTPEAWKQMCAEFHYLIEIAEEYDVYIGIEPELANVIDSAQRAHELIDTMQSHRLRIVFDPANLFKVEELRRQNTIIEKAIELLQDRIELAHAKDRNADGTFAAAGKGVIDFDHYLNALHKVGFSGTIVTHGLAADESAAVRTFLADCISKCVTAT